MVARALLNQRTPKLSILLIINQNDMNRENQMRKDGADVLSFILFYNPYQVFLTKKNYDK